MKTPPRDGIWTANGLSADFRFLKPHPEAPDESLIETAAGNLWVFNSQLTYDPVRDLTPEAAAVVAGQFQGVLGKLVDTKSGGGS